LLPYNPPSNKMSPRLHCLLNVADISRLIEEEGADVNHRDIDGSMALHVSRSSAVARTLIEHGADVNAKNSRGMSPLHRVRNVGVATVLLKHGALVDAVDNYGNTPLHLCNDTEVVKLLLRHSATVSLRNNKGETPIHMSTYGSKVVALAKAGADIDSVDNAGKTLLMKKARCFYVFRLLSSLLGLNPSAFLKDNDGKTALDYTIDPVVRARIVKYLTDQNWRRRKVLVLLRERTKVFVAKDDLVLRTVGLPMGVFRHVVGFV
jgi:ankyrin repeat protein